MAIYEIKLTRRQQIVIFLAFLSVFSIPFNFILGYLYFTNDSGQQEEHRFTNAPLPPCPKLKCPKSKPCDTVPESTSGKVLKEGFFNWLEE